MEHSKQQTRRAGVLLHISSLPGPFARGVCGQEAIEFINQLADTGLSVWQFLPLGPTHGHGSPYETLSTFAANPEFIDLRQLTAWGWLDQDSLSQAVAGELSHQHALTRAGKHFFAESLPNDTALNREWSSFRQEQSHWLRDFSCFMAIKLARHGEAWWQWAAPWNHYDEQTLAQAEQQYADAVQQVCFEQFVFDRQWQAIKSHAEARGITLFGDLPIYVAHDSSDVWANPEMFTLNDAGECTFVAGVPPDYFSETGQRWGNPLYRWKKMEQDDFRWWKRRVQHQLLRMHWMRIDHFRGLEAYWAIPGDQPDGRKGEWIKAPGKALLTSLQQSLGQLPLIAEDLGLITEEVHQLRHDFQLPGMKILQFAFGGDADNAYLPHNHEKNTVAYTGTHDNDTSLGWYQQAEPHVQEHVCNYLATSDHDMPWPLIRSTLASPAWLSIIPMQDMLALPTAARFNTPGTIDHNWCWRMHEQPESNDRCWLLIKSMLSLYGRH